MKILLKTTAGRTTEVDFAAGTTIAQVKDSLKEEYDLPSLRLCYQGKILEDTKTVDEIGEGAALFIAGKKATLAKAAAPSTTIGKETVATSPVPSSTPAPAATAAPTVTTPPAPAPTTATDASDSGTPAQSAATTTTPAEPPISDELVANIAAMGFDDTELVKLALRAAYMNPDRAVDYLCSGTPRATLQRLAMEAMPAQQVRQPTTASATTPAPVSAGTSSLQDALASIPNFDQIRQVVQQNPASLPTFMQQLQQNHPDVFALVQQNPQAFLDLLQSNSSQGGAGEGAPTTAGPTSVQLTAEDQVAIQELAELGGGAWDLQAAAIVYVAVNKNKEMAAAVLFEHGGLPPQLVQAILDQQGGGGLNDDDEAEDDDTDGY